jgi:hypothetical protein
VDWDVWSSPEPPMGTRRQAPSFGVPAGLRATGSTTSQGVNELFAPTSPNSTEQQFGGCASTLKPTFAPATKRRGVCGGVTERVHRAAGWGQSAIVRSAIVFALGRPHGADAESLAGRRTG